MSALEIRLTVFPAYLHAIGTGERTPQNVASFFRQAVAACKDGRHGGLLFESRLTGRSIKDATFLFDEVTAALQDLRDVRKLAYVPGPGQDPHHAAFAETVARNRGVEARVFADSAAAAEWLNG